MTTSLTYLLTVTLAFKVLSGPHAAADDLRLSAPGLHSAANEDARQATIAIVHQIQYADYAGEREALGQLHTALAPYVSDMDLGARILYWRGFARWRSALIGFTASADPAELDDDLTQCVTDFREALARDAAFVDARIGLASCLMNHSVLLLRTDAPRARDLFRQAMTEFAAAEAGAPDNPRLLWVKGANQWYAPPTQGGGQEVALATYRHGLEITRRNARSGNDPLEPAWGEPELLMNLAFAHLHRTEPDLIAAEQYAEAALALVPHWHYVRDLLLPEIRAARTAP